MKLALSTLLIPFAALALMLSEAAHLGRFSSGATVIQHAGATPTPPPRPPGSTTPGDTGGAHRASEQFGRTYRAKTPQSNDAPAMAAPARERMLDLEKNLGRSEELRLTAPRRRPAKRETVDHYASFAGIMASEAEVPPCDPAEQQKNALSGVYLGDIDFAGLDLRGGATLTICGNRFDLENNGIKTSGVVASVKTPGYTAAAFRVTEVTGLALDLPKTVSVRVSRSGGTTSFRSAPGEPSKFAFIGSGGRRARFKRVRQTRKH